MRASRKVSSLPREIETLCERYKKIVRSSEKLKFKQECVKLIDDLWFHESNEDHVTFKGANLMHVVEDELEDIEDSFGIGFLDMNRCELHFFAYGEENEENIRKFTERPEMAQIYAK
jgi:hypothetical protein